jgi:putative ABC transport system ATP-binding protein
LPPPAARLRIRELAFRFPGTDFALTLPELDLPPAATLRLSGASGCGKTTLLRLIAGLLPSTSGSIVYDDQPPLHLLSPSASNRFRLHHLGLIFQDFALLDYLTAAENILLPARFIGNRRAELQAISHHAAQLAARLDLTPQWHQPVARLSMGERQRVAILRALATQPKVLLADEPTASLDRHRRDQVIQLLLEQQQQTGASLILITHDPELIAQFPEHLNVEALRS